MPNHQDAARAIKNALQFLGPLQELEKVTEQAGEAEKYLRLVRPDLDRLKGELERANQLVAEARKAREDEERALVRLQREGVQLVEKEIQAATRDLRLTFTHIQEVHDGKVKAFQEQKAHLNTEIDRLMAERDRVGAQVQQLNAALLLLRADMAKIAKQAGGE